MTANAMWRPVPAKGAHPVNHEGAGAPPTSAVPVLPAMAIGLVRSARPVPLVTTALMARARRSASAAERNRVSSGLCASVAGDHVVGTITPRLAIAADTRASFNGV